MLLLGLAWVGFHPSHCVGSIVSHIIQVSVCVCLTSALPHSMEWQTTSPHSHQHDALHAIFAEVFATTTKLVPFILRRKEASPKFGLLIIVQVCNHRLCPLHLLHQQQHASLDDAEHSSHLTHTFRCSQYAMDRRAYFSTLTHDMEEQVWI